MGIFREISWGILDGEYYGHLACDKVKRKVWYLLLNPLNQLLICSEHVHPFFAHLLITIRTSQP